MSTNLPFLKMHGLGNDFVVVDGRAADAALSEAQYRAVGDRRRGVGYDQFLTILPPRNGGIAYMAIHNPDGSEAQACGNGTRCVASLLMDEAGADEIVLETVAGGLVCRRTEDGRVTVDMGMARLRWDEIPIAEETDTLEVSIRTASAYGSATLVNMGNPHAVFFVEDAEALDLARIGPPIETDPIFPERANIEFVTVLGPDRLRMRVWERGAGITQACGSGACATVVAAVRRGLIPGRSAAVILDGGVLDITWREDGHVEMTGPVATSFSGTLDLAALGG
ncbi:MAG: diaminopimelate epimerase [Thalassobaculum sp.]